MNPQLVRLTFVDGVLGTLECDDPYPNVGPDLDGQIVGRVLNEGLEFSLDTVIGVCS